VAPATVLAYDLRVQYINPDMILTPRRMICVAAKWIGDPEIFFFAEWLPGGHDQMVRGIYALVDEAEVIVTYNGTSYDMPMLHTEFALLGLPAPAPYRSCDLMRTVKRRMRFMSNRLAFVTGQLGTLRKTDSGGIATIIGVMNGDGDARARMTEYCKNDVLANESLFNRLSTYLPMPNIALIDGKKFACPYCGSGSVTRRGYYHSATSTFQRFRCRDCSRWSRSAARVATTDLRQAA
jgi:uncharacterized protein YprB with RNaseH-like and TPR domain